MLQKLAGTSLMTPVIQWRAHGLGSICGDFLDDASHPVAGPWARKYMPGRASLTWSREARGSLVRLYIWIGTGNEVVLGILDMRSG